MFSRIRASIAGDASSPDKSPHHPNNNQDAQALPQRPGFLPPFFSNPQTNGSEITSAPAQTQERSSFFSGLLPQAASSPARPDSAEASPRTIRASASALLKLASPPLGDGNSHPEINPNSLNDGIDDADLAQRDTLEHQINRRDAYISKLQSDLHKMQNQLGQYQKDNNTLRRQQLESTHRHSIAIKLWRRTNDGLRARVECFENETTPAAAREIANLIRDAAPPNKDSSYLMMLQDQLTKATVKLDHLGSQTEIVLHKGEEVVESLREEMNEVIRERCRMELELLDQERMLEDDMRRMVVKTERRLKRVQGEIDFLEKNAVECLKNQETEDDSEQEEECKIQGANFEKENIEADIDNKRDGNVDDGKEKVDVKPVDKDGDSSGSSSSDDSVEKLDETSAKKNSCITKPGESSLANASNDKETGGKLEHTPEALRKELRKVAMERDRSLSVLQKKLREKNEEYQNLMRLKEGRLRSIQKFEAEKRDREEWERSRQEGLLP